MIIVGLVIAITGSTGLVLGTEIPTHTHNGSRPSVALTASADQPSNFTYTQYQGKKGQTALALLQAKARVTTHAAPEGPYVVSINGVIADGGKNWVLYVNGALAPESESEYVTADTDSIEWKLE